MDPELVSAVLEDASQAPVSARLRAALEIAEAITRDPGGSYSDLLGRARDAGLDDAAIEDLANVAFHFNFINRVADALDFELPTADKVPLLAKFLDRAKTMASRERPSPSLVTAPGGQLRPVEIQIGHEAILHGSATLDPARRVAAEAFTARLRGGVRPMLEVPAALSPYLEKLANNAYKITDEDLEALRDAGYDKDGIFELTLAGAWGASMAGLEGILGELSAVPRARPAEASRPRSAV